MINKIIKKIKSVIYIFNRSINHPLNKNNKINSIFKILKFNIGKRLVNKNDIIVPWVNDSKFIISKEDAQIRWNIYCGLVEYIEMLFLMHVLRQNNTFIDVGSNVGIYSILASKVIGAKSISFEPHPNTFKKMIKNFSINSINHLVNPINKGVGSKVEKLNFTNFHDTRNILNKIQNNNNLKKNEIIQVEITTLDKEINLDDEYFIKTDTEGYEYQVLQGGLNTIKNKKLIGLIIETNSMSEEFGYSREIIHKNLESNGLILVDYDPFKRKITKKTNFLMSDDNTSPSSIYVRDIDKIQNLVSNAKPIKIHTAYDINV